MQLLRSFPGYTLTSLREEPWIDVQNLIVMMNVEREVDRLHREREKQQQPHRRRRGK
jgi:hypothetical protein